MFKKLLAACLLGWEIAAQAGAIIQCDPNATGNTSYPNVSCTSNGYLNVNATVSAGGSTTIIASAGAVTDGSGTITSGGTSQQIFAANATRQYLIVQNLSSGNLYVNLGAAATTGSGSILLLPNSSFLMEDQFVSNQTVNIIGATTGQAFTAKQK